ncbi:MAG: CotH kinase family protein [Phycisphaerales bacterium]|nr:CotH kinase family protein [Planctomycetota bacterium]MBL6997277.1 CotH kinase family protein [Phycisphaerales bacterium]
MIERLLLSLLIVCSAVADDSDLFFDDSVVQEVRITIDDANWYNTLYYSHANDPDDPMFPASFVWGDQELATVGIRFKGNSSFGIPTQKKSFKIDFDEYDEDNPDAQFLGLSGLALNNGFKDPSFMREKMFLEFASQWVPEIRAVHTRVYVNDVYWGLYIAVEEVDKTFVQSRFGEGEDGNLFKGQASDDASGPQGDFGSTLEWLGSEPEPYYERYQLKTNETANDYSQLIAFIDALNNSTLEELPDALEPLFDVDGALHTLALNILFSHLDSYTGSAHNYYVYDRDDTGKFTHIHWDLNETFGRFRFQIPPQTNLEELDLMWSPNAPRPMMQRLLAVEKYQRRYLRIMAEMIRNGFHGNEMEPRITQLADLIRDDVYADTQKQYSDYAFETNLYNNYGSGQDSAYGIQSFASNRHNFLRSQLDALAEETDMQINEMMSVNTSTMYDEYSEYDPWVEIYNLGPGRLPMQAYYLSDDAGDLMKWHLPSRWVQDGEFPTLWIDGQPKQGSEHAPFTLNPKGGELILSDGSTVIDSVTYPALQADKSYGRQGELSTDWAVQDATPNYENEIALPDYDGILFINEFMADNESTIADEAGEFDDWIELFNNSDESIDLSGMFMTDDLTDLIIWQIPDGVSIDAGSYLLIWADKDAEQGSNHADFKLGTGGEDIGLIAADGVTIVDSLTYTAQSTDISYGRIPDGGESWTFMSTPTPESANQADAPEVPVLFINEFMADNETTIEDPDDPGAFEDWIEIYNPNEKAIDMTGLFMTDDLGEPGMWVFQEGVIIDAYGYLLVWADNDAEQGPTHTTFKLGASGEEIGLFASDGSTIIDSIVFGAQETDVSYGRLPDGGDDWQSFNAPTPGTMNEVSTIPEDVNGDGVIDVSDLLAVVGSWGSCDGCPEDINGDGQVDVTDLLAVIAVW